MFVLALLGIDPTTDEATAGDKTSDRYVWEPINPSEAPPLATRLLHAITQRQTCGLGDLVRVRPGAPGDAGQDGAGGCLRAACIPGS